jgi:hypothetical protein
MSSSLKIFDRHRHESPICPIWSLGMAGILPSSFQLSCVMAPHPFFHLTLIVLLLCLFIHLSHSEGCSGTLYYKNITSNDYEGVTFNNGLSTAPFTLNDSGYCENAIAADGDLVCCIQIGSNLVHCQNPVSFPWQAIDTTYQALGPFNENTTLRYIDAFRLICITEQVLGKYQLRCGILGQSSPISWTPNIIFAPVTGIVVDWSIYRPFPSGSNLFFFLAIEGSLDVVVFSWTGFPSSISNQGSYSITTTGLTHISSISVSGDADQWAFLLTVYDKTLKQRNTCYGPANDIPNIVCTQNTTNVLIHRMATTSNNCAYSLWWTKSDDFSFTAVEDGTLYQTFKTGSYASQLFSGSMHKSWAWTPEFPRTEPSPRGSTSCTNPSPNPAVFQCENGVWVSTVGINATTIVITGGVVIGGDLTVADTLTFSGLSSTLKVNGCVIIDGGITIILTKEEVDQLSKASDKTKLLLTSGCDISSLETLPITIEHTSQKKPCEKVTATGDSANGGSALVALFKIDTSKCRTWWIILAAVLGGVVFIALILTLVFTLSPKARKCIRPHSTRMRMTI